MSATLEVADSAEVCMEKGGIESMGMWWNAPIPSYAWALSWLLMEVGLRHCFSASMLVVRYVSRSLFVLGVVALRPLLNCHIA